MMHQVVPRQRNGWRLAALVVALMTAMLLSTAVGAPSRVRASGPLQYIGTNLAGAEFAFSSGVDNNGQYTGSGTFPGTYGTEYGYPTHDEVDYFQSKGMNVFRIPFRWERIQPNLDGDLDNTELYHLIEIVNYATNKGLHVLIDVHNYARYTFSDNTTAILGMPGSRVTKENFGNLWARLAGNFNNNTNVFFGLMNEPFDNGFSDSSKSLDTQVWVDSANTAIQAIRNTESANGSSSHLIMVAGMQFSGVDKWFATWYGNRTDPLDSNGKPSSRYMLNIVDPSNNYVYEVHQYIGDPDGSNKCDTDPNPDDQAFTQWLYDNHKRAWLGEFNVGETNQYGNTCELALNNWLNYLQDYSDVWLGATFWAAGPLWGGAKTLEPTKDSNGNYVDSIWMTWLRNGGHLY